MKGPLLTLGALSAFALNSILCRAALASHSIDPASFTALRLGSGALVLLLVVGARRRSGEKAGSSWAALALFTYASASSFAYLRLHAGVGALILFGAVQITMIGWNSCRQWASPSR